MDNSVSKEAIPPRLTPELLHFLDKTFPDRCAQPGETVEQIWVRSGQRSVVAFLIRIFEEQNENVR